MLHDDPDAWKPYEESLFTTLVRTVVIGLVVGALLARWMGGWSYWPIATVLALWFSFGGHWVVGLNQGGRYVAMAVFLILGISLLFPSLAERLTRPLVDAGSRLQSGPSTKSGVGKSFVLGISTGLLWAPCAGPILGSGIVQFDRRHLAHEMASGIATNRDK